MALTGWSFDGSTNYLGILKTDTVGNIKKIKYLPDPDNSGISWSTEVYDDKLYYVGMNFIGANSRIVAFKFKSDLEYDSVYTKPYTYDSLCPDSIVSHTIMPDCDVVTGLQEPLTDPEQSSLKVFPNPASRKVMVEMPGYLVIRTGQQGIKVSTVYHKWKLTVLEVFDLSGNKIFEKEIIRAQSSLEIDVSQWQRGMYNFRLMYNKQVVASEKVIIR
jgi:hypothetical protein